MKVEVARYAGICYGVERALKLAAEAADGDVARWLHLQRGAPLLKLEAQLYAQDGRVVDYSLSYFVPGYFRFHVVRRVG